MLIGRDSYQVVDDLVEQCQDVLIGRDSYQVVDDLVEQCQALLTSPFMQGFPAQLLDH